MAPRQPMMLHRNAATPAASRASGQATNADFHRSVAVVIIALLLLLLLLLAAAAVLAPLWINSERIDKTTIRPSDVQAAATMRMSEVPRAAKSAGTWFPFPRRLDSGSSDRSSGWVRQGLSGAISLVSWLTVGPGAGLGGQGIRRGVVAVRCPACTVEQRLEDQQDHASHRHPDTSSGQDVQGIVHP